MFDRTPTVELITEPESNTNQLHGGAPPQPRGSLIGEYVVKRHLGRGGMADIYLVTSLEGRPVALKHLRECHLHDEQYRKMLVDEATLMRQLDHPNVVSAHDISNVEDGYFTMEFVDGASLARADRCSLDCAGRPLPVEASIAIALRVAAALQHAHSLTDALKQPRNVVHRDVSVANVLIGFDGSVKLTDFGVATASYRRARTRVGHLKGNIGYMSPEQVKGEPLDRRSDIFSLGIVLWELLTGSRLFEGGTNYQRMRRITDEPIRPPSSVAPELAPELDRVVLRALQRAPAERYQSALDFIEDLAEVTQDWMPVSHRAIADMMRELFPEGASRSSESGQEATLTEAPYEDFSFDVDITFEDEDEDGEPENQTIYLRDDDLLEQAPAGRPAVNRHVRPRTDAKLAQARRRRLRLAGYPNRRDITTFFTVTKRHRIPAAVAAASTRRQSE